MDEKAEIADLVGVQRLDSSLIFTREGAEDTAS